MADCDVAQVAFIIPNGQPTAVAMRATVGGDSITSLANMDNEAVISTLQAQIGDPVEFSWNADGVSACLIEATLPIGVTLGTIHTGSNWNTPTGDIPLGPIDLPGDYIFGINCTSTQGPSGDEDTDPRPLSATVIVQVAGCACAAWDGRWSPLTGNPTGAGCTASLRERFYGRVQHVVLGWHT